MSRLFAYIVALFEPSGRGRSMIYNYRVGRYRVRYSAPPGLSMPMCKDVAKDYAKLFHGVVEPITKREGQ